MLENSRQRPRTTRVVPAHISPFPPMPASDSTESARSPHGLATFGCENCREQHLKCDRVTPTCGRCFAARRECRRTTLKIRAAKKSFHKKQKWVKTPIRLEFVDETRAVIKDATNQDSADDADAPVESPGTSEDSGSRSRLISAGATPSPCLSVGPRGSPTDRFIQREPGPSEFPIWAVGHVTPPSSTPQPSLARPLLPLADARDAQLFRHFVQHLASWLDLCDGDRSFETIIPQRASGSEVLMCAILSLASAHLVNTRSPAMIQITPFDVDQYYGRCIKLLHPSLENLNFDADVFAATIIMRVWEEINVVNNKTDLEGYMLSIHRVAEMADIEPGSLSAASFWVGLRQEIYVAVIKKEIVRMPLVPSLIQYLTEGDDFDWANRAVLLCAEVLNHCYDRTKRKNQSRWEELFMQSRHWAQYRPASFTEIYQQDADEHAFPEVWYRQGCHAIGMQHYLLAELYLARYDARERLDRTAQKTHIQSLVRRICGIGLGNQWTPPSMFTACMAIAAFEDWFDDDRDLDAMMDILEKTEKGHSRPTETVRRKMESHRRGRVYQPMATCMGSFQM
ncbi:hypothetical protein QBC34DRAFT_182707 [Podospora aff. communis PSN243]|uniref:Zn(2)-C6 fungal-type domain-containing protein n=1 Tax=Podospora aff. communis PSN243 TaxID=3040156 RepID=A0AAV9G7S1_9PEZI|nr:hypothetical protein QBC34DRAFT_182707 [Podospora aff. communis PSN243]